jgi:WD40 repeat protein
MLPNVWWRTPPLLFRFLGARQTVLLLGGVVGIGIAIFTLPQDPEPSPVPFPDSKQEGAWVRGLAFAGPSLIVAMPGLPKRQDEMVGLGLWDADSGRQRALLAGHAGGIHAVAFTADGQLVASAGYDENLRVWDVATGRETAVMQRPQAVFHSLTFDPAGGLAWIEDGFVRHWDPITGAVWVAPPVDIGEAISMAFSPDDRLLVTAESTGTRLWELPAGLLRAALPHTRYPTVRATFSPSGRTLATGDVGGQVELWDTETGQQIRELPGLPGCICGLAFSADNSSLAAVDVQGTVKRWDLATGREEGSFSTAQLSHEEAIDKTGR